MVIFLSKSHAEVRIFGHLSKIYTEGYLTWDVSLVLKTSGAERPGVRFCHPSARTPGIIRTRCQPEYGAETHRSEGKIGY